MLFQLENFVDKQLSIPNHYSICYKIYLSILYLNPLILVKREWDGKGKIQLSKKCSDRENVQPAIFSSFVKLDFDNIFHYHGNTKQLKNKISIIQQIHDIQHISYHTQHFVLSVSSMYAILPSSIQELKNLAIFKIDKQQGE